MVLRNILSVLLFLPLTLKAQDIQQMLSADPLKVKGSVNLSSTGYVANGVDNKRDPFIWIAQGNLGITIFGMDVPLTFSYSNRKAAYTQPFNRFSLSPSYKWIKTYIGYGSMTFSNYTLAGHQFFGGGVELTPGNWYIGLMYGRLKEAVPFGTDSIQNAGASFKRMGYGIKTGYNGKEFQLSVSLFKAADELPVGITLPENIQVKPMENIVSSIAGRKKLFGQFSFEGEYAHSVLTTDIRVAKTPELAQKELLGFMISPRSSTAASNAMNAGITWEAKMFSIQARIEQVDAGYQSLGAYYANSNFRNYTLVPTLTILKGKLNLAANVGLQEDNLNHHDDFTSSRWVGSVNANCTVIEKWNFNVSYSNFTNYTKSKPLQDPFYKDAFDSLSFYQISQSATAGVSLQFGKQTTPQGLMGNFSYQRTGNHPAGNAIPVNTDVYTANFGYTYAIPKSGVAFQTGLNTFMNKMPGSEQVTMGPMAGVNRIIAKVNMRCGFNGSYNQVWQNHTTMSSIVTTNINFAYNPKPKNEKLGSHSFTLNAGLVKRFPVSSLVRRSNELTITAMYGYSF